MASGVESVSVITPVLNEAAALPRMLEAMRAQSFDGELEFLIVDGGSQDDSLAIVAAAAAADPRVKLLHNPQQRIPCGLNVGLRSAGGTYVARMDAHTIYPHDYLQLGVDRLRRGDVAWVSGPQVPRGAGRWGTRVELALRSPLGVGGAAYRRLGDAEIDVDSGFTGVWRRPTLTALGGWDEAWTVNEDGELAARVRAGGGRIVCLPQMAADYLPRDDLRRLARQYWRYGQFRAKTAGAHPQTLRRSHVVAPALVVTAAAAVAAPRPLRRVARAGVAVYAAALGAAAVRTAGPGRPADGAGTALVLATMHASWGAGFLIGSVRFGPPLAALGRLARGLVGR